MGSKDVIYRRVSGTLTNVGTSEETTIQLPVRAARTYLVHKFHFVRTGGSAATYSLELGRSATWTTGDIDELVAYSTGVAVATKVNTVFAAPVPIRSDSDGKIYLRPGFNTGSDNDAKYALIVQLVKGGAS